MLELEPEPKPEKQLELVLDPERNQSKNPAANHTITNVTSDVSNAIETEIRGKTHFPDFLDLLLKLEDDSDDESDSDSDDEEGSDSDDEEGFDKDQQQNWKELEEKYSIKEDADVAVFLKIAERMPLKSLMHLLHGNVYARYHEEYDATTSAPAKRKNYTITVVPIVKKFRWEQQAEDPEQIQVSVYEIEDIGSDKELWWNAQEMDNIKKDLIQTISFFRSCQLPYIRSLEVLAEGNETAKAKIEEHLKNLTKNSFARGLETHMLPYFAAEKKKIVRRVLHQQMICQDRGDAYDRASDCIRKQSLLHSGKSTTIANQFGQCDEIDALKANMSRWEC